MCKTVNAKKGTWSTFDLEVADIRMD